MSISHNEISGHTSQNGYCQGQEIALTGKETEKGNPRVLLEEM